MAKKNYHAGRKSTDQKRSYTRVAFEVYGTHMLEKTVRLSGTSGRIYLPSDWIGHTVKVVRIT
jgi:putative transposon-encoded protein